jgi:hypothetical protein
LSASFVVDPRAIANTSFFVRQLYLDLLNREPDPAGLAAWTDWINDGVLQRSQVAAHFFQSPEFKLAGLYAIKYWRGIPTMRAGCIGSSNSTTARPRRGCWANF